MGCCDSSSDAKKEGKRTQKNNNQKPKTKNNISSFISQEGKSSLYLNLSKKSRPNLINYEPTEKNSYNSLGKNKIKSANKHSEEEVIIKGELNPNCPNKEEDFNNYSFIKEIKKKGLIKKNDKNSFYVKNRVRIDAKENISEMKSKYTVPDKVINKNSLLPNYQPSENITNNINEINNQNIRNNNLRASNKIQIALNEDFDKNNQYMRVPMNDDPMPDLEDLSTSYIIPSD